MEGESKRKHIAIMKVNGTEFEWEKIVLRSVRPFIMRDLEVDEEAARGSEGARRVESLIKSQIEEMIEEGKLEWCERNGDCDDGDIPKPLIRLRVSQRYSAFRL